MGKLLNGKVMMVVCLLAWVFVVRLLSGCSVEKEAQDKVRDLDFTVVGEADLPQELASWLQRKRQLPLSLPTAMTRGCLLRWGMESRLQADTVSA